MRAYVVTNPNAGELQEMNAASLTPYDARVAMQVSGICSSTDRMVRSGTFPPGIETPFILGHESVGRVVEIGSKVRHLVVGQLVTRCSAFVPSEGPLAQYWGGFCDAGVVRDEPAMVEDGALAAVSGPWRQQSVVEGDVDPVNASLAISLSEALSVARDVPLAGRSVAVIGTGVAGLGLVAFCAMAGARLVICVGRRDERLIRAQVCGATHTLKSTVDDLGPRVREISGGGVDVVFEASGDPSMILGGAALCRPGGRVVVYGLGAPVERMDWKEFARDVSVSFPSTDETGMYPWVLERLERGDLEADLFVTHRFAFTDIADVFESGDWRQAVKAMLIFD